MRGQRGRCVARSEAAATVRSRGPSGRASIRAADDVLEADLQSDEILACFEEALGERQPEMGTDAAAGREANAESAEAAPRRRLQQSSSGNIPCLHRPRGAALSRCCQTRCLCCIRIPVEGADRASQMPAPVSRSGRQLRAFSSKSSASSLSAVTHSSSMFVSLKCRPEDPPWDLRRRAPSPAP